MARPERFELPTTWFVARYSIQLSYGRAQHYDNRRPAHGSTVRGGLRNVQGETLAAAADLASPRVMETEDLVEPVLDEVDLRSVEDGALRLRHKEGDALGEDPPLVRSGAGNEVEAVTGARATRPFQAQAEAGALRLGGEEPFRPAERRGAPTDVDRFVFHGGSPYADTRKRGFHEPRPRS